MTWCRTSSSTACRSLGVLLVLLVALQIARPTSGMKINVTPAVFFGFFAFGMVFVGMLGNLIYAIDDARRAGHRVRGGLAGLHRLRGRPRRHGGARALGAEALGQRSLRQGGDPARVRSASPPPSSPRSRSTSPACSTSRPGVAYDDDDLQIWNILSLVGHGLMAHHRAGVRRIDAELTARTPRRRQSATIRGRARPSSGPPRRRPRATTSSTCRSSTPPNRCSICEPALRPRPTGATPDVRPARRSATSPPTTGARRRGARRDGGCHDDRQHARRVGAATSRRHRPRGVVAARRRHDPRGSDQRHVDGLHRHLHLRPVGGRTAPSTTTVATRSSRSAARSWSPCS